MKTNTKGYSSVQLGAALYSHQCTSQYLGDITGADSIPQPVNYPIFFIVNSSSKKGVSGHWILLFMQSPNSAIEYFDSLGKSPGFHSVHIKNYLSAYSSPNYIKNNMKLQASDSFNCGLFCAYVADKRCQGVPFTKVMQQFNTTDLSANDHLVEGYYKQHIKCPTLRISHKSVSDAKRFSFIS